MNKYLGILRWSLNYQDGTADNAKPMDEETRKWLMEAIESQVVDPVEQMTNILKVLEIEPKESSSENDTSEEFLNNRSDALDELVEYVENIDLARDFNKVGGIKIILKLLNEDSEIIRRKAAEVLALVVQNHPELQSIVLKQDALDVLLRQWKKEGCTDKEKAKLLYAISCLIRGSTEGTVQFIEEKKGVVLLLNTLDDTKDSKDDPNKSRLTRKVLFLLRYLLTAVPSMRPVLVNLLMQTLGALITHKDIDIRESSLKLVELTLQDTKASENLEKGQWYNDFVKQLKDYAALMALPQNDPAVVMSKNIANLLDGKGGGGEPVASVFAKYEKAKPMKMTNKNGTIGIELGNSGDS
mmetsp:Transcript_8942/g.10235  ORF Transcript_8942/g.10235 Transcript_8942/m.10235 type:complete len:355 (-) Transcript_8942:1476-2540(-)|eukprot:CAMPEP_0184015164 /NCGR_PEP_ID=MMETSP0954-20121128/6137_1 /TAXON_ID=627963 /ORGANISM="Aplanochytrium sp, Strain PBS07" /LENGTH=354 /DNA_ID=CAMNT_0026295875 /DNA_START=173 /DNA_END=1237 /DNA_ORIENTATION=+